MSELMKTIKCSNCSGNIKLDFDNLISYCPYCGSALTIDVSTMQELLIEKEKTKQIISNDETEKQKNNNKTAIIVLALLILFFIILVILV